MRFESRAYYFKELTDESEKVSQPKNWKLKLKSHQLAAIQSCIDLENNGIDLSKTKATLGPLLSFDPDKEEFTGDLSNDANELVKGDYREGFQIPDVV